MGFHIKVLHSYNKLLSGSVTPLDFTAMFCFLRSGWMVGVQSSALKYSWPHVCLDPDIPRLVSFRQLWSELWKLRGFGWTLMKKNVSFLTWINWFESHICQWRQQSCIHKWNLVTKSLQMDVRVVLSEIWGRKRLVQCSIF